jgi:hypothetical protein
VGKSGGRLVGAIVASKNFIVSFVGYDSLELEA